MSVVAFILFVVAAILFLLNWFTDRVATTSTNRWPASLTDLGLCLLTTGFIVQFCEHSNKIHF